MAAHIRTTLLFAMLAAFALSSPLPATADPISDENPRADHGGTDELVFYRGDSVVVRFLAGDQATHFNRLYLFRSPPIGDTLCRITLDDTLRFIMDNRSSSQPNLVGFSPGAQFGIPTGAELVFGIHDITTDNLYFIGPACRNPDNHLHIEIAKLYDPALADTVLDIGFEDLFGGGDHSFNDLKFRFAGITTNDPPIVTCPDSERVVACAATTGTELSLSAFVKEPDGDSLSIQWSVNSTLVESRRVLGSPDGESVAFTYSYPASPETSVVELSVSDGTTSIPCRTLVIVRDDTAPTIAAPGNIVAQCAGPLTEIALGDPTVIEACDPNPTVTNDAPPLGRFPIGLTIVTWTATDAAGNSASSAQSVRVEDHGAPIVIPPPDVVAQCRAATDSGTVVDLGTATAFDSCGAVGAVTNDAPASFPLGVTLVTWTARDASGNVGAATQRVSIVDDLPPLLVAPPDLLVACGSGKIDLGQPVVFDSCDARPTVTNDAPAVFPPGVTYVSWRAVDASGNRRDSVIQVVTVQDSAPPQIIAPPDVVAECQGAAGTAVALGEPTVVDPCDSRPVVTNDAPALFPVGRTIVTWSARDANGNVGTALQSVTVQDSTPPRILTISDPVAIGCAGADSVALFVTATDGCDAALDFTWRDETGRVLGLTARILTTFAPGNHLATVTVHDDAGNAVSAGVSILARDASEAGIHLELDTATLWPPNHRMVRVARNVAVTGGCDSSALCGITVTSNEPADGHGDGNTEPDWRIDAREGGRYDVWLRAERSGGGAGRVYTITVCAAGAGGVVTKSAQVTVGHDLGKKPSQTAGGESGEDGIASVLPRELQLLPNVPNPFGEATTLRYALPERASVRMVVFDLQGREVRTWARGDEPAGFHSITWDGRDGFGRQVSTGIYVCRLEAGARSMMRKLVLSK